MKRFSEQMKKQSESIRLSAAERRDLRERIVSYMEYHPLPKSETTVTGKEALVSEPFTVLNFDIFSISRFAGALAVLFLVVIPVVAQKAVPGDVLYPVKVSFNEEIKSSLTFSPYEKVEWETERLERRISEARLLADAGLLTPEVEEVVAEAIKQHSDAAQEGIETIRESDSEEAALAEIAFTSALEVQSEVLEGSINKNASSSENSVTMTSLAGAVDEVRASVEGKDNKKPSFDKLIARIETETTRAYEFFSSIDEVVSNSERKDIDRRLLDIKKKVASAILLGVDDSDSLVLLTGALIDTRKLISFMTNIDVRENVSIEDLVPITLTFEERSEAVNVILVELVPALEHAKSKQKELPNDLEEKISTGIEKADSLLASASTSLATLDIEKAEADVKEAKLILDDILLVISVYTNSLSEEGAPETEVNEAEGEAVTSTTTEAELNVNPDNVTENLPTI